MRQQEGRLDVPFTSVWDASCEAYVKWPELRHVTLVAATAICQAFPLLSLVIRKQSVEQRRVDGPGDISDFSVLVVAPEPGIRDCRHDRRNVIRLSVSPWE